MFAGALIGVIGTPGDPAPAPQPSVTCNSIEIRVSETDPRVVSFDPTTNDFTNDGATIEVVAVGAIAAAQGTIGEANNIVTVDLSPAFAGIITTTYQVETSTGATGGATITIIVDGITQEPFVVGTPDAVSISSLEATRDFDIVANDVGSGAIVIAPGSLTQPASGPTLSIVGTLLRVTRNNAAIGTYQGFYRPQLADGSVIGASTLVTIQVTGATLIAPDFTVSVQISAAQPFVIDPLARVVASAPVEIASITQPTGATDSAAITGSGVNGKINYTRSTTGAGVYTMTYTARVIGTGITDVGTITIQVANKWWVRGNIQGGRSWHSGPGYWERSWRGWITQMGRGGAFLGQAMVRGTSERTWEGIWGGSNTESLSNLTFRSGSQMATGNTFWDMMTGIEPDSAFVCAVVETWPSTFSTSGSPNERRIYSFLDNNRSFLQSGYTRWGARIKKRLQQLGWRDFDLFILRPSHEMNQSNIVRAWPETRQLWRNYSETVFEWMRDGFGDRMRIVHSPARSPFIGPYDDWVPRSTNGGVDCLTVSYHPNGSVFNQASTEAFFAGLSGQYGHDDVLAAGEKYGLPYCNPEWGPNYFVNNPNSACRASDLVVIHYNKFLRAQAKAQNLVFETQYNQTMLQTGAHEGDAASRAAWSRMVGYYRDLWRGTPVGQPHQLDTTDLAVGMTTSQIDINPFPSCTGSEAIRISRVISAAGGLSASIVGTGASARVRINRNNATNGAKRVVVEMTLANRPFLTDLVITVHVGSANPPSQPAPQPNPDPNPPPTDPDPDPVPPPAPNPGITIVDAPRTFDQAAAEFSSSTEYFVAPGGSASLSTNSGSPGSLTFALANAPDLSIVTLLGSGTSYGSVFGLTGGGRRLWLRADNPCIASIDTAKPSATVNGVLLDDTAAHVGHLSLSHFGGILVDGLAFEDPTLGGLAISNCNGQNWIKRCLYSYCKEYGILMENNTGAVIVDTCWVFNDKLAANMGGSENGWHTKFPLFINGGGEAYVRNSFIQGNYNQIAAGYARLGLLRFVFNSIVLFAEDTYPASWPDDTRAGTTVSGAYGIVLGWRCDGATGGDETCGDAYVEGNKFASKSANFVMACNARRAFIRGNYVNVCPRAVLLVDTGGDSLGSLRMLGPTLPESVVFTDNDLSDATGDMQIGKTFSTPMTVTVARNAVSALKPIRYIEPNRILGSTGSPAGRHTTARPTITRDGGNASGFAAPTGTP